MVRVLALVFCCLFAACTHAGEDAKKTAAALRGDDKHTAAGNPICKLFSRVEAARYIGEPAGAGHNAAGGCQWSAEDGSGDMIVAVVPASYHDPPKRSPGYKALADVGAEGFVAPYMDGWLAGAIVGKEAIRVSVAGAGASEATAVALLQDTIKRRA